jgi:sulfite exporter TauE/SafE
MIFPALIIGLAGSLHCVGMCGPIAMSVPIGQGDSFQKAFAYASYHIGRLSSYALIGFLFGVLGYGLDMAGLQQILSLSIGVFMLLYVWFPRLFGSLKLGGFIVRFQSKMTGHMAKMLKSNRTTALLGLGFFNGFLPCGLVYVAIAASMATYDPFLGALFMVVFGLGTVPALLGIAITGQKMGVSFRSQLRKVVPILVTVFAILFILRGLGLGIPYLSPELEQVVSSSQECAP